MHNYFLTLPEPEQSALLFIRQFFIEQMQLQEQWKFNTPFYYYQNKWFCYISYNKKNKEIYIGFVRGFMISHPALVSGNRKQIKVYYINANDDINIEEITHLVELQKATFKTT